MTAAMTAKTFTLNLKLETAPFCLTCKHGTALANHEHAKIGLAQNTEKLDKESDLLTCSCTQKNNIWGSANRSFSNNSIKPPNYWFVASPLFKLPSTLTH